LTDKAAISQPKREMPRAGVGIGGSSDPRRDPSDPRYDPRMDPNNPGYDPNDPRNRGQYPTGTTTGTYPPSTYPSGGTLGRPGIILNTGGGEDLSRFERELAEKDFRDKAHTPEPVPTSMNRDRFLYFSIEAPPAVSKGYTLRLPVSKGIPQEAVIRF
jgi:hypothetical protein